MNIPLMVAFALVLATAIGFGLLFQRMFSRGRTPDLDLDWLSTFSIGKYRPMERLLSEEDYVFLASQEGFDPRISAKLRSERRKIFRGYLRSIRTDFNRLEAAVRLFMVESREDNSDLAKELLKRRLVFMRALFAVEVRLALHWLGLGSVDVRELVGCLEAMRGQLSQFAMARAISVA
ncbi:MAG: hypothetical protein ABFD60_14280 [Bryobacteraceae bacterium]